MGDLKQMKKQEYFTKLNNLLEDYPNILLVDSDNVRSSQIQAIRKSLRDVAVILCGKNTMIRKVLKAFAEKHDTYSPLLPHIKGNTNFIFYKGEAMTIKKVIDNHGVAVSARVGSIAPLDVVIQPQVTTLQPTQTSFFAALSIATKISRGAIEILNPVHILHAGQKVGASQANLLAQLDMKPFRYCLDIKAVFEKEQLFTPEFLKINESNIINGLHRAMRNVIAVGGESSLVDRYIALFSTNNNNDDNVSPVSTTSEPEVTATVDDGNGSDGIEINFDSIFG